MKRKRIICFDGDGNKRVANITVLDAIDIVCGECIEYDPNAYDPCAGCPVRATADRLWKEQGVEIKHL